MIQRILIVEDDIQMQRLLLAQLKARGYDSQVAESGERALKMIGDFEPHLVLLDISLPGMSGLEVCRSVRAWSEVPIILLTAADLPQTKIDALEMGADDYLTKPFHTGELVARMGAVMRRSQESGRTITDAVHSLGDVVIDLSKRTVQRGSESIHLTKIEFDLLREFVIQPDRVLTYDYLISKVWGPNYYDVRPVHVHVCNLRRKIETGPTGTRFILAVPGVGYRLRLNG